MLALLCEGDSHGWALVRALAPEGEIGGVWSIRRALVYRTVELVIEAGLVERAGLEPGSRGSARTLLRATPSGRLALERWLAEPVAHVRDLRSELLLKLLFAERADIDPAGLLTAQRAVLEQTTRALESASAGERSGELTLRAGELTVRAFRLETARAGQRFVAGELARRAGAPTGRPSAQSTPPVGGAEYDG